LFEGIRAFFLDSRDASGEGVEFSHDDVRFHRRDG
jgi:hypothetical protein